MEINNEMDFRDYTCTNFMIKLKILLKKLKSGDQLTIISTREQYQNLPKKIFKNQLQLEHQIRDNNIHVLKICKS